MLVFSGVVRTVCAIAGILALQATVSAAETDFERLLLKSTVRFRSERMEGRDLVTGHGTAFGVDLKQFGYPGKRYLLSAAHNVLDNDGRLHDTLKLEMSRGAQFYWTSCKVVAFDQDLDICLVECKEELPEVMQLDNAELAPGNPLLLAGSPRGIPVALFRGFVMRRFYNGSVRSAARIAFDHGDSGGPMVSPRSGRVAGVAVAGIPKDGDLDHTVGLFVPLEGITSFLETIQRKGMEPATTSPRITSRAEIVELTESKTSKNTDTNARFEASETQFLDALTTSTVHRYYRIHTITSGDSLHKIVKRYGVTYEELIQVNSIKDSLQTTLIVE
jgi:LysM repeat protein